MNVPSDVKVGPDGAISVTDYHNNRLLIFRVVTP